MARPLAEHYRRIAVGLLARYGGKGNRCLRDVVGWLAAGPESTRTGVMRIHTGAIADDLGWPRAQVDAAIQRLHSDGAVIWCPDVRVVACLFVLDVLGISTTNHKTSALNQLGTMPDCEAVRHARKDVQTREIKGEDGASNAPRNAPSNGASYGAFYDAEKGEGRREKGEGKERRDRFMRHLKVTPRPQTALERPQACLTTTHPPKPKNASQRGSQTARRPSVRAP